MQFAFLISSVFRAVAKQNLADRLCAGSLASSFFSFEEEICVLIKRREFLAFRTDCSPICCPFLSRWKEMKSFDSHPASEDLKEMANSLSI